MRNFRIPRWWCCTDCAIKKVTKAFRLELAQYQELRGFAQFGAELDDVSKRRLARGERAISSAQANRRSNLLFIDQTLMLFLLQEEILDKIAVDQVHGFCTAVCELHLRGL